MLPDIVLLDIFDFYMAHASDRPIYDREMWITLVHVCRKWREIVFESPRRLNLRLLFTLRKSVRKMLDTWPPLLIDIVFGVGIWILAALEHGDRIRQIELYGPSRLDMERALAAMRKPFPELIYLSLNLFDGEPMFIRPIIRDSFLGGSAPRLQSLELNGISFSLPALKKLLCLPPTLSKFVFGEFRIPGTFHPKKWSLAFPL